MENITTIWTTEILGATGVFAAALVIARVKGAYAPAMVAARVRAAADQGATGFGATSVPSHDVAHPRLGAPPA